MSNSNDTSGVAHRHAQTASTYIQKRLQADQPCSRQHSIRFEDDSKNQLKIAARRSDFKPWKTRLKQARSAAPIC